MESEEKWEFPLDECMDALCGSGLPLGNGKAIEKHIRMLMADYKAAYKNDLRTLREMREIVRSTAAKSDQFVGRERFVHLTDMLSSILKQYRKNIDNLQTYISSGTYDSQSFMTALALGLQFKAITRLITENAFILDYVNLKPFTPVVSDEQILQVRNSGEYPTDREQAERLGISERTLYRRLKKIKGESDT